MPDVMSAPADLPPDRVAEPPSLLRWTALCAAAETIGMAASSAAATIADSLIGGDPITTPIALTVLAVIVSGGLVEGVALGVAQARGLAAWLSGRRARWIVVTVVIAGIGWAGASVPAVVSTGDGGDEPPTVLIALGAAGLGLTMGAVLGVAQALVLRGRVPHPWRWILASALGWTVGMPVVFLGAAVPGSHWALPAVIATGAATGLAAGAVIGSISGLLLPCLVGRRAGRSRIDRIAAGRPTPAFRQPR